MMDPSRFCATISHRIVSRRIPPYSFAVTIISTCAVSDLRTCTVSVFCVLGPHLSSRDGGEDDRPITPRFTFSVAEPRTWLRRQTVHNFAGRQRFVGSSTDSIRPVN